LSVNLVIIICATQRTALKHVYDPVKHL